VRLGCCQPGQVVGERQVDAAGAAELVPGPGVDLLLDRIVVVVLEDLAAGGALEALGLPDVGQVIVLSDGHHHGQTAAPPCRVTWPRD